jgi:glutamate-1-semialdehyde 2,1-aminomutase
MGTLSAESSSYTPTFLTMKTPVLASGPALYRRAKTLIPGGTQLLSKRPENFAPEVWPSYYNRAKGVSVWDLDDREYIDMSILSVGACILGYADPDVDGAVMKAIQQGVASSLNCPEEVELAETLIGLHPWADMVRFARGGGEAVSIAVRIARASTRKDLVLFSGYHGWADWYLAANLADSGHLDGHLMPGLQPTGVPRALQGSALPFPANNIDQLKAALKGREHELAAIIIEPARGEDAAPGYLGELKAFAAAHQAVLIFDEITSGFRMNAGGIHLRAGVSPHLAVFAKCMANGYAMAAVIGTESVMQAAQSTFISSTNWTERVGPTAALATIAKYQRCRVDLHIQKIGNLVKDVWREKAAKHHLALKVTGLPTLGCFTFDGAHNQVLQTYFTSAMLDHGFLAFRQFKPSYAHQPEHVTRYAEAVDAVFATIASTPPDQLLKTPVALSGFHRLTKE